MCFVKCVRLRTKTMEYMRNFWKVNFTCVFFFFIFFKERRVIDPTIDSTKRDILCAVLICLYFRFILENVVIHPRS